MSIHVVYVEEDQQLQEILKFAFESVVPTATITQFANADAALPYIQEHCSDIDLYIISIQIAGAMNGLQLAEKIREMNCPGHVVLTSTAVRPTPEMLTRLRSEYYAKPWHIYDVAPRLLEYSLHPKDDPPQA
jgi:DNA-binding NtrC family response regulator